MKPSPPTQEWKSRREVPDPQVKDAADQFNTARRILADQGPGTGVLLPTINAAAMAIELYLKSLAAEKVYAPDPNPAGGSEVRAQAAATKHELSYLYDAMDAKLRVDLERAFAGSAGFTGTSLRDSLLKCGGAFVESRYPFEPGKDVSRFDLSTLNRIAAFLADFIADLPRSETVEW